jgi:hypothetical protein
LAACQARAITLSAPVRCARRRRDHRFASLMHTITMRDGIGEQGSHGFVEISAAKCRLGVI